MPVPGDCLGNVTVSFLPGKCVELALLQREGVVARGCLIGGQSSLATWLTSGPSSVLCGTLCGEWGRSLETSILSPMG